jgi:hypothetical protein
MTEPFAAVDETMERIEGNREGLMARGLAAAVDPPRTQADRLAGRP